MSEKVESQRIELISDEAVALDNLAAKEEAIEKMQLGLVRQMEKVTKASYDVWRKICDNHNIAVEDRPCLIYDRVSKTLIVRKDC